MKPRPSTETAGTVETERLLTQALVAGLLVAAVALALFTWLGREALTGITPALDDRLRQAVNAAATPTLTSVMRAASRYGGPAWLMPAGLVLTLAFLLRGWRRGAVLVVVTMAGAGLLDLLLKLSFARVRPTPFFGYPLPSSASFPSGHALFAASFFGGLAVLITARVRHGVLRVAVWALAVWLTLLVGLSRVYLGVHYPSDVLAGYAAAVVWVAAVAFGDRVASHRLRRRPA
ncbi:MAG: phosphatase PAP2 family protein [Gemmatimonadales bacterium]